ncbi:MAG: hypothetical protein AAB284_05360 [Chloroflexota bacterium]|mgnify:FL=1
MLDGVRERALEEGDVRGAEQLGLLAALLEDQRREPAGVPAESSEDGGAGEGVVERAVGGIRDDGLVSREPLERVRRRRRAQDRRQVGGVETGDAGGKPGPLEEGRVEPDVVPDETEVARIADEPEEFRDRRGGVRRADEVGVVDPGQARDRRADRTAGVDEGDESLTDLDVAGWRGAETDRADLDDAVAIRVEPRRLEVDRDEPLLRGPLF